MWPELILVYLFSLKAKGYNAGELAGIGPFGSLILDMMYDPPKYLIGKAMSPENLRDIALIRIKEKINEERK